MRASWNPRIAGLVVIVSVIAILLAACGGGEEAPPAPTAPPAAPTATAAPAPQPTVAPPPVAAATPTPRPAVVAPTPIVVAPTATPAPVRPKYGGTYRVRLTVGPTGWDGHRTTGYIEIKVLASMFNNVLMTDLVDATKIIGDLADRWDISPDGLTYSFHFPRGIKWHDGTPFSAADVAYSYRRIIDKEFTGYTSHIRDFFSAVDKLDVVDPENLKITLLEPRASFLSSAATLFAYVYPQHKGVDWPKSPANPPIGTGPFKFVSYEPEVRITVARNPDYFKSDQLGNKLPYLDSIEYVIIRDPFAAFSAFRTGQFLEVDFFDPAQLNTNIDRIKREKPDYTFGVGGFGSWRWIMFSQRPPFNDVRVREALDLLMDRPKFAAVSYPGYGKPEAGALLQPELGGAWGLREDELKRLVKTDAVTDADIARAQKLLVDAGVDIKTWTFNLMVHATPPSYAEEGVVILDSWKRAGINGKVLVKPTAESLLARNTGDFEVHYNPASAFFDDPDFVLGAWYPTGAASNGAKWSNPELDRVWRAQQAAVDPVKRKQLVDEVQRIILKDHWYPKVVWAGSWAAWSPRVKNYNAICPLAYCHKRIRHEYTWLGE